MEYNWNTLVNRAVVQLSHGTGEVQRHGAAYVPLFRGTRVGPICTDMDSAKRLVEAKINSFLAGKVTKQ